MIHLFNKTYIEIDPFLHWYVDRIVISETNGYPIAGPFTAIAFGDLIAYGTEMDQVVGEQGTFKTFIEMFEHCYDRNINTGKKVIIYCDKKSYSKVLSNFLKIIFSNLDSTSAYRMLTASFARSILIGDRTELLIDEQIPRNKPTFEEFNLDYSSISNPNIEKSTTFLNKIKNSISVEYLLASYYYNGSYKNELKKTIWSMINRNAEEQLKEAYRAIQTNILSEDVQQKLGTKKYTIENILEMTDEPALDALKRTNAWRASGGIGMPREEMNITNFNDQEIQTIKNQLRWFNFFVSSIPTDTLNIPFCQRIEMYIDNVRKPELSDQDLDEVLNFEYSFEDDDRFWSLRDRENINIYLIEYLMELNRKNDKEGLKPYVLR